MKNNQTFFILFFSFFILSACSKENDTTYNRNQMFLKVLAADEDAKLLNSMEAKVRITCEFYSKGCLKVYRGLVMKYEVLFVHFETIEQAKKEAEKRKTLYIQNWIVDGIMKEKVLINFFKEKMKAKEGKGAQEKS